MMIAKKKEIWESRSIWVISGGRYIDTDITDLLNGVKPKFVKEYRISQLARYLLNPKPIEVKKKLIGCRVYYRKAVSTKIKEKIAAILPKRFSRLLIHTTKSSEAFISRLKSYTHLLKDEHLSAHINKIEEQLRSYDLTRRRLLQLDVRTLSDITGICEEFGEDSSVLTLKGELQEKMAYILSNISTYVRVRLEQANISNGLFEMRGFDFADYDPNMSYKLLKISMDRQTKFCVLNSQNELEFWLGDEKCVSLMHLLEHSIQTDPEFHEAFQRCVCGDAKPIKIFFNTKFEIDYSEDRLPNVYKEAFRTINLGIKDRNVVMNSLNSLQLGIAFNYISFSNQKKENLIFNISVMHDVKALDPIKTHLPGLYSEITKKAFSSEAGRFYLLDSIRGYQNA